MNTNLIIQAAIVLVCSGFFSGLEIAFVSSNKLRFEMDREQRSITSRIIDIFYNHPNNFISTLLVGNNIALVIYGIIMAQLLGSNVAVQTIVSTIIVLLVGEFLPKTLFRMNPNGAMHVMALPMLFFYILLWPVSKLCSLISKWVLFMMGMKVKKKVKEEGFSRVDLDHLIQSNIDNIDNDEEIEDEVRMFQNALDFSSVRVRDCIVPRTEIVATDCQAKLSDIQSQFVDNGISKLIIYKEDIDNIIGFLHSSEMFRLRPGDDWTKCIRDVPIVPETMTAQKLLSIFTGQKKSLAVVVDEFGGTSGIVTLEDLVEEIFGDIEDEHDNSKYIARKLPTGEYQISARLEIEKINELLDLDLPESDEYLTLGGYILNEYQSFPKLNEVIRLGKWEIRITKNTTTKIEEVLLKVIG